MQSRDLPSAQFEGAKLGSNPACGKGSCDVEDGESLGGAAGVQGALPQGGSMQLPVD